MFWKISQPVSISTNFMFEGICNVQIKAFCEIVACCLKISEWISIFIKSDKTDLKNIYIYWVF